MTFKLQLGLILIIIFQACNPTTPKEEASQEETLNTASSKPELKEDKTSIAKVSNPIPYTSPKNLEELYKTVYVVDTFFTKIKANESERVNKKGRLLNEDLLVFNKIVGIDTLKTNSRNRIFPMKAIPDFDPIFMDNDNRIFIPFSFDREFDRSIFLVWKKLNDKLEFQSYLKNIFPHKYGRNRIVDIKSFAGKSYFLGEKYLPDEDGLYFDIWLAVLKNKNELKTIHQSYLKKIDPDSIQSSYHLDINKNKLRIILNKSANSGEKTSVFQEIELD